MSSDFGVSGARLVVVVLNYNNYNDTAECIDLLLSSSQLQIVLVDNASKDNSGAKLQTRYKCNTNVFYLQSEDNQGYAAGNNIGIRFAIEQLNAEFICVLNNDTLPEQKDLFELVSYLERNPNCGVVGPVILENQPGEIIQSAGANINLWKGDFTGLNAGDNYSVLKESRECQYLGGACLVFRSSDITKLGYIPENYFLFFEETEWCLRATRKGMKVVCDTKAKLIHKGSASVSEQGNLGSYLMVRNSAVFEKRNASKVQLFVFLIRKTLGCFKRSIASGRSYFWELSALKDGLTGRLNSKFSYIDIVHGDYGGK